MSKWDATERLRFRIYGDSIVYALEMTLKMFESGNLLMAQGFLARVAELFARGENPDIRVAR